MTSRAKAKKRLLRWHRYLAHYGGRWSWPDEADRFARFLAPPGALRAYNAEALTYNNRRRR